jgi:DNA repair exonuclease SbcCD nuclease subunit
MSDFFFTSDIHFGYYRSLSEVLPDGTTSRLHEIAAVLDNGMKQAECDLKIIAGDVLVQSKNIDYTLGNFVKNFFKKIPGQILVIPGNHDIRYTFGQVHSILKVILPDNVTFIEQPTSWQLNKDVILHFIPFHPNIDTLKQNIEDIKILHDKVNILVSHFSVEKAFIRDDFSVAIGKKWEVLRLSLLKRFDFVFLGDIHLSQMVEDFVFYPGSPTQLSYGEEGQEKATWKVAITPDAIKRDRIVSRGKEFKTIEVFTMEDLDKVRAEEHKGNFVRVHAHIPVAKELNLDRIIYKEVPREAVVAPDLDYRDIVINYTKEKDPEVVDLLKGYLK